jgi:hypothetical protein
LPSFSSGTRCAVSATTACNASPTTAGRRPPTPSSAWAPCCGIPAAALHHRVRRAAGPVERYLLLCARYHMPAEHRARGRVNPAWRARRRTAPGHCEGRHTEESSPPVGRPQRNGTALSSGLQRRKRDEPPRHGGRFGSTPAAPAKAPAET